MNDKRRAKLESLIQQELSQLIQREVKDPRVTGATITSIKLTKDAKQATVFFTLLGSMVLEESEASKQINSCLNGLNSAASFIRKKLSNILNARNTPRLVFKEDKGLYNTIRVHTLLKQIEEQKQNESTWSSSHQQGSENYIIRNH